MRNDKEKGKRKSEKVRNSKLLHFSLDPFPLYLVWLEWPEKCFRVDAEALRCLRELVPAGSRVVRVKGEAAFLRALPKATHAIVWNFKGEWFARAPRLKVLATPAAGQELVPTVGPKGVKIHFGHYHGEIMAESVAGFLLAWAKGFFAVRHAPAKVARWPRTWLSDKCYDVAGTKAVVVGYGNVGRAIGRKLSVLGVDVYGVTRHGIVTGGKVHGASSISGQETASPFLADGAVRDVLREADWLVLALPSTTGTDDWLDAKRLRQLPRRCVVVNVGRGNAIDEQAHFAALKAKRLAGAYLDVRKFEPSGTVPEFGTNAKLEKLSNCVVMPHSSAFSPNYLRLCFKELKDDRCL